MTKMEELRYIKILTLERTSTSGMDVLWFPLIIAGAILETTATKGCYNLFPANQNVRLVLRVKCDVERGER